MESKTDSKSRDDGETMEGIEFNSNRQENVPNKKLSSVDNKGCEKRIVEPKLALSGIDVTTLEKKPLTKTTTSTKTLSFSIERMLNFNKNTHTVTDEQLGTTNQTLKHVPDIKPLKSTIKKKYDSVHSEERCDKLSEDREDREDCDSNDVNKEEVEEAEESMTSSNNPFYTNSSYYSLRDECSHGDLLPIGLNSRPVWPSFFSYLGPQWSDTNRDRYGLIRRVGHPYQNRTPPKRKKPRTAFTRQQVMELEKRFSRQKYLASAERSTLAKGLNMSDSQVKTWFQNRRTKWRRQTSEEREMERQAAKKFLLSIQREENQPMYSPMCATPSNSRFHPGISRALDVRYIEQN